MFAQLVPKKVRVSHDSLVGVLSKQGLTREEVYGTLRGLMNGVIPGVKFPNGEVLTYCKANGYIMETPNRKKDWESAMSALKF